MKYIIKNYAIICLSLEGREVDLILDLGYCCDSRIDSYESFLFVCSLISWFSGFGHLCLGFVVIRLFSLGVLFISM